MLPEAPARCAGRGCGRREHKEDNWKALRRTAVPKAAGGMEWEEVKGDQEGADAAEKTGEARGEALEKPDAFPPRRVSEGPVSHQKAAFSPRHHRALLAGRSQTSAACTRLSRGS